MFIWNILELGKRFWDRKISFGPHLLKSVVRKQHNDGIRGEGWFLYFSCSLMKNLQHEELMWLHMFEQSYKWEAGRQACLPYPRCGPGTNACIQLSKMQRTLHCNPPLGITFQMFIFWVEVSWAYISDTTWTVLEVLTKYSLYWLIFLVLRTYEDMKIWIIFCLTWKSQLKLLTCTWKDQEKKGL